MEGRNRTTMPYALAIALATAKYLQQENHVVVYNLITLKYKLIYVGEWSLGPKYMRYVSFQLNISCSVKTLQYNY